jgi:hypothetical protein
MNKAHRMKIILFRIITVCIAAIICATPASAEEKKPDGFRLIWAGGINLNIDKTMKRISDSGFNAAAVSGANLNTLIPYGQKYNVEIYYWFHIIPTEDMKQFAQQMSPEDNEILKNLNADKSVDKNGYQFGGEPLPGHREVLETPLLCFHRPETVEFCKKHLDAIFERFPQITGIAFDYIGYRNYRGCQCRQSTALFEEYYKKIQDKMNRETALEQFSLETLVQFSNELSAYIRKLQPKVKIATHVYPVFMPDPLYGNRLDVDYCCQTVAWFFKPYWTAEKIERYTRYVIDDEKKYFPDSSGIPFIGLYQNPKGHFKSDEEFFKELEIVKKASPSRGDLSVCTFAPFAQNPELGKKLILKIAK